MPKTPKRIRIGDSLLYCGDCLDILPKLDIEANAVITDPPFGNTDCDWDKALPLARFWEIVKSKTIPSANFILFACGQFTIDLINNNRKWYRYDLIWQKSNKVGFLNAQKQPMRNHETILVFGQPGFRDKATYNPQKTPGGRKAGVVNKNNNANIYRLEGGYTRVADGLLHPCSVLSFGHDRGSNQKTYHPTMKPLALMEWLVKTYTDEGDVIIDPFMGSGSTGLACARLGRRFVGIEREPKYFSMAVERVKSVG